MGGGLDGGLGGGRECAGRGGLGGPWAAGGGLGGALCLLGVGGLPGVGGFLGVLGAGAAACGDESALELIPASFDLGSFQRGSFHRGFGGFAPSISSFHASCHFGPLHRGSCGAVFGAEHGFGGLKRGGGFQCGFDPGGCF